MTQATSLERLRPLISGRRTQQMTKMPISTPGFVRSLCLAAAAVFALSAVPIERAAAMSPINPGISPPAQSTNDLTIQVRGGHGGGGHGGGGHFGGGHIGGGHFGGHVGGGGWHGARVAHFGGYRYGGFRHYGGYHRRFYGGGYYHRRFY